MQPGIELFFGIVNDACFGKVIVFGTGGIFTELFKDICFIDSESSDDEIKMQLHKQKFQHCLPKVSAEKNTILSWLLT